MDVWIVHKSAKHPHYLHCSYGWQVVHYIHSCGDGYGISVDFADSVAYVLVSNWVMQPATLSTIPSNLHFVKPPPNGVAKISETRREWE
jgi:hypothetical protein